MGLPEVSTILWRERQLLDQLVFKLDAQQMLVDGARDSWMVHASNELEALLEELRHVELVRAMEVDAVAVALGLRPNPSFSQLVAAAPAPFDETLSWHRLALVELAADVRERSRQNADALGRGHAAVSAMVASAGAGPGAAMWADDDVPDGDTILKLQLHEVAYQAALAATPRAIPPSLVDFLQ